MPKANRKLKVFGCKLKTKLYAAVLQLEDSVVHKVTKSALI